MKVILRLIRPLNQRKRNKIRQSYISAFLAFLFLFGFCSFPLASEHAADSGDEVVNTFSFSASNFRIGIVNNPLEDLPVYSYDPVSPYFFTKFATALDIGRFPYRCYVDYIIDSDLTSYSSEKYVVLECTLAYGSNLLSNSKSYYYFYDIDGNVLEPELSGDREVEVITLEFQGTDVNFYKNYLVYRVDDLSSFTSEVYRISFNQYFNSLDTVSTPFLFSDLSLKFYNSVGNALTDINNNIEKIQDQNNVIINNLSDVKNQLDSIHNNLTSDTPPGVEGTDEVIQNTESIEGILNDGLADFIERPVVDDLRNNLDLIFTQPRISAAFIFWGDLLGLAVDTVFPLQLVLTVAAGLIIVSTLFALFRGPLSGERDADRLSQNARDSVHLTSLERQQLRDQNNRYRGG